MKELLEAGVHFGHPTRRWNPKMKRFIYGGRNGIYIIDLHQTLERLDRAARAAREIAADGGIVLFVGTKRQAQESVRVAAESCSMPHMAFRWPGGFLTNFRTLRLRIDALDKLEREATPERLASMAKRQAKRLQEQYDRLHRMLGGVRNLTRLPEALFLVDLRKEHIAVEEARRLGIRTIAIVDTDRDPDLVDFPIPSNDDAIRAIRLISNVIAEGVAGGRRESEARRQVEEAETAAPVGEEAVLGAAPAAALGIEALAGHEQPVGAEAVEPAARAGEEGGPAAEGESARQPRTIRKHLAVSDDDDEES